MLGIAGCDDTGKLDEFFRPAPVQSLAEIIRISIPIGHCATVAMANQNGYQIPYESIQTGGGVSLIRIIPTNEFPMLYLDPSCREILILSFPAEDDFSILSIFFVQERIIEWHTIPVILEDGKIKAVFASQDIHVRDSVEVNLQMGLADIRIELERVEEPVPESRWIHPGHGISLQMMPIQLPGVHRMFLLLQVLREMNQAYCNWQ